MLVPRTVSAFVCAAALIAACSGDDDGAGAGGDTGAAGAHAAGSSAPDPADAGAAGASGSAADAGGSSAQSAPRYADACPDGPMRTDPCSEEGLLCTYGQSPLADCRDRAECRGSAFVSTTPACAAPAAPSECPPRSPTQNTCPTADLLCAWEDGTLCSCMDAGALGLLWFCEVAPIRGDACPALVPNAGSLCDPDGPARCEYGTCQLSANRVVAECSDGSWRWSEFPCAQTDAP